MTRALRHWTAGCALALATVTGLAAVPANAATGSAPVTSNDAESIYGGNAAVVSVLANDTDPDGDELALCRVAETDHKGFEQPFADGNDLVILAKSSAKPGTYTFTYYACDFSYLTPGTVTLTIDPTPKIKVKKLSEPGKLKVTNPADFRIQFLFGSFREPTPDGEISIKKNTSVVITVHRSKIGWISFTRRGDFLKIGRVKNIQLPPGDHAPAAGRLPSPRMATAWRAQ